MNPASRRNATQGIGAAVERWPVERVRFIELLSELERHNLSSTPRIIETQRESVAADLLRIQQVDSELIRYTNGGRRLENLIQCLRSRTEKSRLAFQLLLHSDPFVYHSGLRLSSSNCQRHLEDGNAAFYLRLSIDNSQSEAANVATPSSTSLNRDDEKYFVFSVAAQERTEAESSTEIADIALLFASSIADPQSTDWATFHGHFERKVRVVSDSTPHSGRRSFVECLTDQNEKLVLKTPAYAAMRAQLAFVVASSLFYKLCAEGLHDIEATHIHYHNTLDARRQELDYTDSRISPYISLDTIGSTAALPSSADALIRSTWDDLEERMMKNLGILIYEIGAWTRVTAIGLQERVELVDDAKEHLRRGMITKYRDVVNACLSYSKRNDRDRWMIDKVILPLKEVYESIRNKNSRR